MAERRARVGRLLLPAVGAGVASYLIGRSVASLSGNPKAPWVLGRAAGITSYLLLVALVVLGLVLAHPWRDRLRWAPPAVRLQVHVWLASFTAAFTILHVVVLATDPWAGVGWSGALLPMAATYRPMPVTLGVVGLWSGLLSGVTAAMAGRLLGRLWWPVHKVAAVALALVWAHGMLAGSDSRSLLALYLGTGALVLGLAVSRYAARTTAEQVADVEAALAVAAPQVNR